MAANTVGCRLALLPQWPKRRRHHQRQSPKRKILQRCIGWIRRQSMWRSTLRRLRLLQYRLVQHWTRAQPIDQARMPARQALFRAAAVVRPAVVVGQAKAVQVAATEPAVTAKPSKAAPTASTAPSPVIRWWRDVVAGRVSSMCSWCCWLTAASTAPVSCTRQDTRSSTKKPSTSPGAVVFACRTVSRARPCAVISSIVSSFYLELRVLRIDATPRLTQTSHNLYHSP